jgi:hypothetical protein
VVNAIKVKLAVVIKNFHFFKKSISKSKKNFIKYDISQASIKNTNLKCFAGDEGHFKPMWWAHNPLHS